MSRRSVDVYADWSGLGGPRQMGALHVDRSKGKEIFSFEYAGTWLGGGRAQVLDPRLRLDGGPQWPRDTNDTFGLFKDSAPDKFGRALMRRREAQAARTEGRAERVLTDFDYLLGVHDAQRMGAMRFRASSDGPFLDDSVENAAPPLARLRELEAASLDLERDGIEDDRRYAQLLRLLAPGSSLGGARPKAGVLDPQGRLWIAKFPSRSDDHDMGGWEAVTHGLAVRAGIRVSNARVMKLGGRHRTFLSRRFDRTVTGERIHFASAMTMLERVDGDDSDSGASYLELADFLIRGGANVNDDLEQLWRRIVFFMCVSNVDDHLRNHGFLLEPARGWHLAPAYDMNPVATANGLTLNVSDSDNAQELALAREVSSLFRVKPVRASAVIDEVVAAVRGWRGEAKAVGLSPAQQEQMARAFRVADA